MHMDSRINVDQNLAESFKQLVLKMPIEKITIKDITDGAGVIRPTFYNHFQDKYDLLEWIVKNELLGPLFPQIKRGHLEECLVLIFTNALIMKVFASVRQRWKDKILSRALFVNVSGKCCLLISVRAVRTEPFPIHG